MNSNSAKVILQGIGRVYLRIVRRFGAFLAFVAGAVILAGGIVLPVWYFADRHRTAYTVVVLCAIGGGILYLIIRNIIRKHSVREEGAGRAGFVRFLWQFFAVILFLAWIYGVVIFLLRGMPGISIVLILIFLIVFGLFLYVRQKTAEAGRE